ncbi:MAG: helix-turn-helix transcriptional regulator [Defluviitaleaceae bacterium]|nr:helix-turn-helix transcriptional regulator [Defluviitaleaceae bacterium]
MEEFREDFKLIGLKIAYYRKMRGLTQEQLSEKLGYGNVSYIGNIEAPNVYRAFTLTTLLKIAKTLDIHPNKLLDYDKSE